MRRELKKKYGENWANIIEYKTRRRSGSVDDQLFDSQLRPVTRIIIALNRGYPGIYDACFDESIKATVVANEGFALGGIRYWTVASGRKSKIVAVQFIFMKLEGSKLNPEIQYETERFGRIVDERRAKRYAVKSDGRIVCGLSSGLNGYPAIFMPVKKPTF